jgi:hypothetical protein
MPYLQWTRAKFRKTDVFTHFSQVFKSFRLKSTALFIVFALAGMETLAQSTNANLNEDYYHWIDRYETLSGKISKALFTTVKPYQREAIVAFADSLDADSTFVSKADQFNRNFLRNDSWEWSRVKSSNNPKSIWNALYKKKSDLLYVDKEDFDLHVNPIGYFSVAKDSRRDAMMFVNTRGVEVRGMIDRKIGFYTSFFDNQSILPQYVEDGIAQRPVIPHEGFWKEFKDNGVDYLQARGYISFRASKHVNIHFGHDRTFIGNGYRSLILSDFSAPNLFLRGNVKVWRMNYMYQLNRLTADVDGNTGGSTANGRYPQKFFAFHHASFNIGRKLNIGVFESVVFSPKDTTKTNYFDFAYLNPIIFFRAVEQQFGSNDNVILGADFKWIITKGISLYGQFVLDEFLLSEIKAGNGWWANKYGIQGGAKWIDAFGAKNLDLQGEVNVVRPYTYSHGTTYGNYSNYLQPLAHPAGSNFKEFVGIVRYQPIPRLFVTAKAFLLKTGKDNNNQSWGSDILKNNNTRQMTYGNKIAQGNTTTIQYVDLTASYMLFHNWYIDLKQVIRKSESTLPAFNNNTALTSVALRVNIAQRTYEF